MELIDIGFDGINWMNGYVREMNSVYIINMEVGYE